MEKVEALEELFEIKKGTLAPETKLAEISSWDSMTTLSLIVLLEEKYGKTVSGKEIRSMKTVADILQVMG